MDQALGVGLALHGEPGGEEIHATVNRIQRRAWGMRNDEDRLRLLMKEQLTHASPVFQTHYSQVNNMMLFWQAEEVCKTIQHIPIVKWDCKFLFALFELVVLHWHRNYFIIHVLKMVNSVVSRVLGAGSQTVWVCVVKLTLQAGSLGWTTLPNSAVLFTPQGSVCTRHTNKQHIYLSILEGTESVCTTSLTNKHLLVSLRR